MVKDIPAAIDNEIACLEQAKALLSASGAVSAKRKPCRLAKVVTAVCPKVQETRKRHKMSGGGAGAHPAGADQALGCINAFTANMNATVAPLPKVKKKAAKAA